MTLSRRKFVSLSAAAALGSAGGVAALSAAAPPTAAKASRPPEVKTGGIRLIPVDGQYHVWTKKVGSGKVKVLTLHGGPGFGHEYFECFEDFLPRHGIEFYYYDQLGSYYSDQPDDTSFWTVDRFREEVEQVRRALELENFYLYGHSWGGMLGVEYALKYPHHLKGLVISDMTASVASYNAYAGELRKKLPPEVIAVLEQYEAKGEYHAPEYEKAMFEHVYTRHICRLDPWPDPVLRTFKHLNEKVYNTMQGPNEFVITGNFKDWDRWKDLPAIRVPTQLIVGRHDTMNPADIQKMGRLMPRSRVLVCEKGSHLCMYDDQETYFRGLLKFFDDAEAGRFGKTTA